MSALIETGGPAGPYEHTGAYRLGSMADAMAHVEQVVAGSTKLQATKWETYSLNGMLWVRVVGSQYEAHAWHVAVGGRAFGSHVDSRGVRRQMIIGSRVCVEVIDDPNAVDREQEIREALRGPSDQGHLGRGIAFVVAGIGLFLFGLLKAGHNPDMRVVGASAIVGLVVLIMGTGFARYRRHNQADAEATAEVEGRILPSTSTDHFQDGV